MHCYTLGRRVLNIIVAILVQLSRNRATLCTFFMCRFVSLRLNLRTNFDVLFMVRALSFATIFYLFSNFPSRTQAWRNWKGARVIRCDLVDEIVKLWLLSGNRALKPLICELQVTLLSRFMNSTNAGFFKDRGVGPYVFLLLIWCLLLKNLMHYGRKDPYCFTQICACAQDWMSMCWSITKECDNNTNTVANFLVELNLPLH